MGASCYSPVGRALRIYQRKFGYRTAKIDSLYGSDDVSNQFSVLAYTVCV